MSELWFRAKRFGWGWAPFTWQGWAITFGFVALILAGAAVDGYWMRHGGDRRLGTLGLLDLTDFLHRGRS